MTFIRIREYAFKKLCQKFYSIDLFEYDLMKYINKSKVEDFSSFFKYFDQLRIKYPLEMRKHVLIVALRTYPSRQVSYMLKLKLEYIRRVLYTIRLKNQVTNAFRRRLKLNIFRQRYR